MWNLFDQAVSTQHAELASDAGGTAALFFSGDPTRRMQQRHEIAVAEPMQQKLSSIDGRQQSRVFLGQRVQRPDALAFPADGPTYALGQLFQGGRFVDGGQRLQVALVGGLADLGPPRHVGYYLPQVAPRL